MGKTLRQVSDVFKPRIGASIALGAVAGMATTPGASLPSWKIAVLVMAGAAAITPELAPASIILAVVLFLWTPPHFWSLATAYREDYALAQVPMLPVIVGDAAAARIILAHTIVLVLVSLLPLAFGMGYIYLAGALAGGGLFIAKSIALVRAPGADAAMSNFHASLVQLGVLLTAAIVDGSWSL